MKMQEIALKKLKHQQQNELNSELEMNETSLPNNLKSSSHTDLNNNNRFNGVNEGLERILNASLVLDAYLSRKKRLYFLNRSKRRKKFKFSQTYLRSSFTIFISVAFVLGFLIFIPMSTIFINFSYQCPLYTQINQFKLTKLHSLETNQTKNYLELTDVNWSSQNLCIYCICAGVLTICYCVISMFFFVMFNIKDLVESDYFLLTPWLTFSSVFSLVVLLCACFITVGFVNFCDGLTSSQFSCRESQYFEWKRIKNSHFYDYIVLSMSSSWLLFLVMLFVDVDILTRIIFIYRNYNFEISQNNGNIEIT